MMREVVVLLVHLLARLAMLLGNRGTRAVLAESLHLKQQLLVLQRPRHRAPNLRPADRVLFGFSSRFLDSRRLLRAAIILKPATLLRFHRGLRDLKYRFLYSSHPNRKPGPKGPAPELIQAICELKRRNPRFGYPKIAQQLAKAFVFRFTIIWESIIVIIREKRGEVIEIIWELIRPKVV